MITCNSCNNTNPDGTATCMYCGQDLLNPTIIQGVASPVAPNVQGISSSPSTSAVSVLIPVILGVEDPTRAVTLLSDTFRFLVGRTDLGQSPPIKPQVDLEQLFPDIVLVPEGYIVSRKAGYLRRDSITGNVFFQAHPDSKSTVIIRGINDPDNRHLLPGDEEILESGTVLSIGSRNKYIEFIAR